ncbi:phospholipid-translocating P-type ATPase, partial [Aureobasidium sp. EXF-3399]
MAKTPRETDINQDNRDRTPSLLAFCVPAGPSTGRTKVLVDRNLVVVQTGETSPAQTQGMSALSKIDVQYNRLCAPEGLLISELEVESDTFSGGGEAQRSVSFGSRLVESKADRERRVDAGPCPDKQDRDRRDEGKEPIPAFAGRKSSSKEVCDGLCESAVRPTRHDCLSAFLTSDTNSNMSFLNHGDVVSTIANSQSHDVEPILNHANNGSFLTGTDTTTKNRLALLAQEQKLLPQLVVKHQLQRLSIDDYGVSRCWWFVVLLCSLEFFVRSSFAEDGQILVKLCLSAGQVFILNIQDNQLFRPCRQSERSRSMASETSSSFSSRFWIAAAAISCCLFQVWTIFPLGMRTMALMRFLDELNSKILSTVYSRSSPRTLTMIPSFERPRTVKPQSLAVATSAASSGDCALNSNFGGSPGVRSVITVQKLQSSRKHNQAPQSSFGVRVDSLSFLHSRQSFSVCFSVGHAVDCDFFELHDVLGERASLVREDVFNLTKIVGDIPRLWSAGIIDRRVVHESVTVDEESLSSADNLQSDIKRDGYQVLEENNGSPECDEAVEAWRATVGAKLEKIKRFIALAPGSTLDKSGNETHEEQDDEIVDDVPVQVLRDLCAFRWGDTRVEHDLGFLSSEDDDTQDPLGVADRTASKQHVVNRDWFGHLRSFNLRVLAAVLLPSNSSACRAWRTLRLNDNVCGDGLFVVEPYKVSNLDVFPAIFLESRFAGGFAGVDNVAIESLRYRRASVSRILCDFNDLVRVAWSESIVFEGYADVIAQIHLFAPFHRRSGHRRVYRSHLHSTRLFGSHGHRRHALRMHGWSSGICRSRQGGGQDNDEQEVDVGDVVELEPQVLGDETDSRVVGGALFMRETSEDGLAFCTPLRAGHSLRSPA